MNITKKLAMGLVALVATVMPFAATAAETVRIESEVRVANVTGGVTPNYQKSATAKVDDIVRVQVWYHNQEEADSGKVAENVNVKINVPTTPGKVQTVTSTVKAANSNSVTDTATVNLSLENAYMEFIPGSVKLRHNVGTNAAPNYVTQTISDAAVTSANGAVVETALQPCFNFESTVTAEFRVKAPVVSIVKQVKVDAPGNTFVVENTAKPGETLKYVLIVKNESNTVLTEVQVGDNLPPHLTYVPGSTLLINSNTGTAGKALGDGITTGGITIDNMNPGSTQYVYFKAVISKDIPAGNHRLRNVGIVRAKGTNQIFNVAHTNVNVTPVIPPTPTPTPQPPCTNCGGGQLPKTGMGDAAGAALGTSALGYAVHSYRRSKKAVIDAVKGIAKR
jgi:uncharacterized repeat protein (TIGR01451 family)